jgi:cellulose biosynthesis protein BcsQ
MAFPQKSNPFSFLNEINLKSSESDIEKKIVIPLLYLLGYNAQDWQSQYGIEGLKIDFLIHPKKTFSFNHPPYLVIEVKSPEQKINHCQWQINRYLRKSQAVFGLLTNGYQFKIFYNFKDTIIPLIEYNQNTIKINFKDFYKLLSKKTCLAFTNTLYKNHLKVYYQLTTYLAKEIDHPQITNIITSNNIHFKENQSVKPNQKKVSKGMIITVFNNKGGVGKTTLTMNLAAALSYLGKKVLLIDIDAQANLTTGLGIDPLKDVELDNRKDITHLLLERKTTLEDTIYKKRWKNIELHLIPSHIRLSNLENELIQLMDSDRVLLKKLKNHDYDFIFIDPPPSFGKVNRISLMASDGILIPTQLAPYPVRALEYVLQQLNQVNDIKDYPITILGIAVSMYDQRSSNFNWEMVEEIKRIIAKNPEAKNTKLFSENTWIPQLNIVAKTPEKGYPLYGVEFTSDYSNQEKQYAQRALECYENLAKELILLENNTSI